MADKPIIFSAPMVRALLEGRKTQTRRIISKARVFSTPERASLSLKGEELARALQGASRWRHLGDDGWYWEADAFPWQAPATRTGWMAHIGYAPGDRLYVREAWTARMTHGWTIADARSRMCQEEILYRADGHDSIDGWWPSIHMPREFSRLTLTVADVRVQRLQDISEADAMAEGVDAVTMDDVPRQAAMSRRSDFAALWNSLHGPEAWDANPWVAAYSFTVQHGNIDQIGGAA